MKRSQKRLLLLVLSLLAVLLAATFLYMAGMSQLGGKPRNSWRSIDWAAETLSTTDYGADEVWNHPLMVVLVVLVQFVGVFFMFLIFPVYLIPFLKERFEIRLPGDCNDARDHVLIFRRGPAVSSLMDELKLAGVTSVSRPGAFPWSPGRTSTSWTTRWIPSFSNASALGMRKPSSWP